MIKNFKDSPEEFRDYDSELLLKILNKTSVETKQNDEKELFVDENWKISTKNMNYKIFVKPKSNKLKKNPKPNEHL